MCGIVGFNWGDESAIKQAMNTIAHRGPDDSGHYCDKVSLASLRLSVIDLSSKGHQPMSRKGLTIVYNGEIYNYKEIKKDLRGYKFTSGSDTEVILHAYHKWGAKCLEKLNGMFAFCIYDHKKEELFIARDRFGIKPLYYHSKSKKLVFASEIKAILPFLKERKVDKKGLEQFMTFRFTIGDTTMVEGVKKLLPGHYMVYDLKKNKSKTKQYYDLEKQEVGKKSFEEYKRQTRKLMEKSVERRMVADVPVACLLSGGIDSTIITGLAKKHNPDLNTFSIGFETTDETHYAKLVAKHFKTKHHEFKINKKDMLKYLDKMVYHMDEPIGDPGFLPVLILSEKVKKHNKVVLSGDGGDEVFAGYDRYRMYRYGRFLSNFVIFDFGNEIVKKLKRMKSKKNYDAFLEIIRLFDKEELKKLGFKEHKTKEWKNKYKSLADAQEFDIKTLLPNDFFMKADKMSSAYGLEQRVPFLDHELVEASFAMPVKHKLRGWNGKYVLKEAFRDMVPEEIIKRKKHGFNVPIDYWFKNVLGEKLREFLSKNKHPYYNKEYAHELLGSLEKKKNNYKENFIIAQKLWSLLIFEMWLENLQG